LSHDALHNVQHLYQWRVVSFRSRIVLEILQHQGQKRNGMDQPCDHCDHPDISLLRVVLIGEIIRADDDTLYTLAGVCEALGLMQLVDDDDNPLTPPETKKSRKKRHLRRVK
jgi:hypothetical protein